MKSYWIAATVVLFAAWPSCSKACVAGLDQSKAEDSPAQQSSNSSSAIQSSTSAQETSVAAQPAIIKESAASSAQAANPNSGSSYILVELDKSLNARKLKPGDKVKAEVSQALVSHGKIIIPVETKLVGHVTEVHALESEHPESRLGIVFDRILLKHSHAINIQAIVQAVAAPAVRRSLIDQPSQMLPPSMMGGGGNSSSTAPMGGGPSGGRGTIGASASTLGPAASASEAITYPTTYTVKQSPSNNIDGSAAQLAVNSTGRPLSVGTPHGVTGLKGLSLTSAPSPDTPGPVIISNRSNVKLESGTQILLHVLKVEAQK
jgi:hypothetical protein